MRHIIWKQEYSLGISVIDNQHKQFLELMDQAYEAFYKNESKEQLSVLIENLRDYTLLHFSTEEKYFKLFNYDGENEHVERHLQLKEELIGLTKKFEAEGPDVVPALIDFLENWLVGHLSIVDRKYVSCFKEHGL